MTYTTCLTQQGCIGLIHQVHASKPYHPPLSREGQGPLSLINLCSAPGKSSRPAICRAAFGYDDPAQERAKDAKQLSLCSDSSNVLKRSSDIPLEQWLPFRNASQMLLGSLIALQAVVGSVLCPNPSLAVLNSPRAQLPRTAVTALRRAIPAFNDQVQQTQEYLDNVSFSLRIPQRKPWGTMANDTASALELSANTSRMLAGVPEENLDQAKDVLESLTRGLYELDEAIQVRDQEQVSLRATKVLNILADLKLLQAPGLPFVVPKEFGNFPILTGRAVVEVVLQKGDGSLINTPTGDAKQTTMTIVLDGYSAPISAGNFAANVQDGLYNGKKLSADSTAIAAGAGLAPGKVLPLEILPVGEFSPLYKSPLDVQYGERPVLPLSIFGSVAMTHAGSTSFAAGDEFFVYKFDRSQAGLAGMSFDEGTFGVFGYVTNGAGVIDKIETGDVIVNARVVSGSEKLLRPMSKSG